MDRVFLDANVLFSAAYKEDSLLSKLWNAKGAKLRTSAYAILEAPLNLAEAAQRERLMKLLEGVEIVPASSAPVPAGITLPDKDAPILTSAIAAQCSHLLTGDMRHFGALYGKVVAGCLIQRPAEYLRAHQRS